MNSSRTDGGHTDSTRTTATRTTAGTVARDTAWTRAVRSPWTVVCAVAAVVLGPAAATASALEQANKAPLHHTAEATQQQAYIPADTTTRRRAAA
ncbi:hypothetical protein [Streptomyces sp. NPDC059894]|uniref:hypothetical protein n=1 Tax=unclassified Streptomyces TaxID=2593676 RepID=UPI00366293E6